MKRVMQRGLEMPYSSKKRFVDDPKAEEFDKDGKHPTQYPSEVFLGKKLTLEQAQEVWRRDAVKENTWGKKRGEKEL